MITDSLKMAVLLGAISILISLAVNCLAEAAVEDVRIVEPISAMPLSATTETVVQEEPAEVEKPWTEKDVEILAKMLWGECRGVDSITEQAACVWCVLNRVDSGLGDIETVVTAYMQFVGYDENHPILPELKELSEDVLERWLAEKAGQTDVGRVLPKDYLWFTGDGYNNYFRNTYDGGRIWDWQYSTPYES